MDRISHLVLGTFDAAYYINLDNRHDRRLQIERELKRVGIQASRISGFQPSSIRTSNEFGKISPGQYGCKVSHIEAILSGIRSGHQSIMIIEDDAVFHPDFNNYVNQIQNALNTHTWDLFFYYATSNRRFEMLTPEVCRAATSLTHCYAVHSRAYFPILRELLQSHEAIDIIYREMALNRKLSVYAPAIDLALQRTGFSDILNRNVDDSHFHLSRFGT